MKVWVLIDVSASMPDLEVIGFDDRVIDRCVIKRGTRGTFLLRALEEIIDELTENDIIVVVTDGYIYDKEKAEKLMKAVGAKYIEVNVVGD